MIGANGSRGSSKPETKIIAVSSTMSSDTTGNIALLNGIQRGLDYHERLGRVIHMKSVTLKLFNYATAGTGVDQFQRVLVVLDKQSNGTALAIADVLTSAAVTSFDNLNYRERFVILHDSTIHCNATGEAGSQRFRKLTIGLGREVVFNSGNAGSVADIATNSLYLISIGSIAPGATAGSLQYATRVLFTDE